MSEFLRKIGALASDEVFVRNTAKKDKIPIDGRQWYLVKIYIDTPADILKTIESVTYKSDWLPEFTTNTHYDSFKYPARVWGSFDITAVIHFKDGRIEKKEHRILLPR